MYSLAFSAGALRQQISVIVIFDDCSAPEIVSAEGMRRIFDDLWCFHAAKQDVSRRQDVAPHFTPTQGLDRFQLCTRIPPAILMRSQYGGSGFFLARIMTAAKGISTDEVLARLRSGERLAQPVLRDVKKTSAFWSRDLYWYFPDETRVTRSAISHLRKRGIIAIVEEVSFRAIKVID